MAARVRRAEVARMAANSSLRTKITSFAAQTVRALWETERLIEGRCDDVRTWTRRKPSHQTPDHRRNFTPRKTATKLPRPAATRTTGLGAIPNPTRAGSTAKPTTKPRTTINAGVVAGRAGAPSSSAPESSPAPKLNCAGIELPPFSRTPHPHGCATSSCPAMLNENRRDLTGRPDFP